MRKTDFALISALYDSRKGGLYADIYFPIIKYTIVSLFYQKEQQQYYTQDIVKHFIFDNFGIEIPSLVLKKSIVAISKRNIDLELEVFDNGAEFKILRAWDFKINEDIDQRAHDFDTHIDNLEEEYRKYIEVEGIESEKTFLDFISDNSDDVLGYFENESVEKINSEYAIMAYFLKHLQKTKKELFRIANELFWGSVIAGFLKREKVVDTTVNTSSIEYFLDTPIVMGLLNLSTSENEAYSKEVIDIIKASGGQLKIHPITMEEVTSIISSVENSEHPIPNTPIEAAWYRDELTKSKLTNRRISATKNLEDMGAIIFPPFSSQNIAKAKELYSNKSDVRKLTRNRGGVSSDRGLFRDIHDIFMDDYIEERRKSKGSDDSCFFVTTNSDLISFCQNRKEGVRMRTISSGKIILELWMHNTRQSELASNALTEMMARCMDMNNRDVRNKLGIVAKYYNSTKQQDFDPKLFQEIAKCLYKRDKDVIAAVDGLTEENSLNIDVNMRIIFERAHQSSGLGQSKLSDIQQQVEFLNKRLDVTMREKENAVVGMKEEKQKKQELQGLLDESLATAQRQSEILEKYAEKERLNQQKDALLKDLECMEKSKNAYIKKNDHYKAYFCLECFLILLFFVSLICTIYEICEGGEYAVPAVISVLTLLITAITALTRKKLYIIERGALHDAIKTEAEDTWKSLYPAYTQKKDELAEINRNLLEIDGEIKGLMI